MDSLHIIIPFHFKNYFLRVGGKLKGLEYTNRLNTSEMFVLKQ